MAVLQRFDESIRRAILTLWAVVWFLFAIAVLVFTVRAWPERMSSVVGGVFLAMGLVGQGVYYLYLAASGRPPYWMRIEPPV